MADVDTAGAINRIRAYYLEQAGPEARWFMLSAHDDSMGVLANMGLRSSPSWCTVTSMRRYTSAPKTRPTSCFPRLSLSRNGG